MDLRTSNRGRPDQQQPSHLLPDNTCNRHEKSTDATTQLATQRCESRPVFAFALARTNARTASDEGTAVSHSSTPSARQRRTHANAAAAMRSRRHAPSLMILTSALALILVVSIGQHGPCTRRLHMALPIPAFPAVSAFAVSPYNVALTARINPHPQHSRRCLSINPQTRKTTLSFNRAIAQCRHPLPPSTSSLLLSSPFPSMEYPDSDGSDSEDEKEQFKAPDTTDDLYEFLTRRQQQQQQKRLKNPDEAERMRKRDRIFQWMSSSASSQSSASNAKIQPIPIDDGSASSNPNEDNVSNKSNAIQADFDNLFQGMPSLDSILSDSTSSDSNAAESQQTQQLFGNDTDNVQKKPAADNTWFQQEETDIRKDYDTIREEMKEQIRQERELARKQALDKNTGSRSKSEQNVETNADSVTSYVDDNGDGFPNLTNESDQTNEENDTGNEVKANSATGTESDIPENAEGIVDSVIRQEMERTLKLERERLARERLDSYEKMMQQELETTDFTATNQVAESILREAEEQYEKNIELKRQLDAFQEYYKSKQGLEQGTTQLGTVDSSTRPSNDEPSIPSNTEDLDQWALKSLEQMLSKRSVNNNGTTISDMANSAKYISNDDVDNAAVLDNLEMAIEELKAELEKKSKKGSVQPESLKEWQMYRSIATRNNDEDESRITKQLEAWKSYILEEEESRKRFGLSNNGEPKMPFEWHEKQRNKQLAKLQEEELLSKSATSRVPSSSSSQKDIQRDMNEQAVQALEDLITKTKDPMRILKLQSQIDAIQSIIDAGDVDDNNATSAPTNLQPVDLTGVFGERTSADATVAESASDFIPLPSSFQQDKSEDTGNEVAPETLFSQSGMNNQDNSPRKVTPPKTPFFQSFDEDVKTDRSEKVPPPKTPFFQGDKYDEDDDDDEISGVMTASGTNDELAVSKLGTLEEQKLRAMYRRAGAKTTEQKEELKAQWQAFQKFEEEQRRRLGMSASDEDTEYGGFDSESPSKYDVADVLQDDGDVNADKILAAIGPRPSRTKKTSDVDSSRKDSDSNDGAEATPTGDPREVAESLYRSIAAVGGGRVKDDPSLRDQHKADFDAYLAKENEMRQIMEKSDDIPPTTDESVDVRIDDDSYAKQALDSIGPRPTFVRKKKRIADLNEREFSDRGGVLSRGDYDISNSDELDDSEKEDSNDYLAPSLFASPEEPSEMDMPEWLRKERDQSKRSSRSSDTSSTMDMESSFSGSDMDDVFDDDKYDHNMRQLAEYQRRRSGQVDPVGIDINDALGRSRGSDDYADYTYDTEYFRERNSGWGASSFEARKAHLLEYTELSTIEVNNLLEHKNSVYATGVSQYMPRINKPFQEFGAIIRLEGVIVDITGLEYKAWTAVAEKFSLRLPTVEDARRASVARSDVAVRDVFYWTKDLQESREIAEEHDRQFQQLFDRWAELNGISKPTKPVSVRPDEFKTKSAQLQQPKSMDIESTSSSTNEQQRLSNLRKAWEETARIHQLPAPPFELVVQSSILPPDITIQSIFGWSKDPIQVGKIADTFEQFMHGSSVDNEPVSTADVTKSSGPSTLDENEMLELQYKAWCEIADEIGVDYPEPEAVFAASVLNDPVLVILEGFEWTADLSEAQELSTQFQSRLTKIINSDVHGRSVNTEAAAVAASPSPSPNESVESSHEPTLESILKAQVDAWAKTAATHGFESPPIDQIQLTMQMQPDESVRRLLAWTYNFNDEQIRTISATYAQALKSGGRSPQEQVSAAESSGSASDVLSSTEKDDIEDGAGDGDSDIVSSVAKKNHEGPTSDELFKIAFDAWTEVAWKKGFTLPDNDSIVFAMAVGPEEAILNGFGWAKTAEDAVSIAAEYRNQIALKRSKWQSTSSPATAEVNQTEPEKPLVSVTTGVADWIHSLRAVDMGCGVTSYLSDEQVAMLLDFAGLAEVFPPETRVSADSQYDRDSQQLLGVALRIERRPDQCIVFDTTPYSAMAAQEVEMRSVAFVGPYPRYDLLAADTSAVSFTELTAMNIRRLFGERVYDQPQLDMVQAQPKKQRKVLTRFWDDD